ncbi:unnamed protein product, partial [Rotaria sordida]
PQEKQPEKVVEEVEEVKQIPEEKKPEETEIPIKEVEEGTTVTLTVQLPEGTSHKIIILLKDKQPVKPSERIKIISTSSTTIEIQIIKAKPQDTGKYSVLIDKKEQPIVQLKVIPKPVTRQIMDIPQTTFNEGETLTIECEFDSTPEETFVFLRNGKPLKPNDRISTIVEDNKYTIVVKNLRPKEDEGVYTLKSDHLILDTPSITVAPKEKKPQTETTTVEEEEVTVTTVPVEEKQPKVQESEKQPKVREEEEQPKVQEEEKQPKVQDKEKQPKVPEEEKQPKVPEEDKQPKVPEEEGQPKVQEEEKQPKVSEQEKQPKVPQEEKQPKVQEEEMPKKELPVHEVEETTTVTLTVEQPQTTKPEEIVLLKDGEELKPSDHVKITPTSPTTTEIQITKVKPEDEGDYTVKVKDVEQPLVRLKVHPKPVIRQEIELPKIQFNEKETLTIACQFDGTPEEPFVFLHNDEPIVPDSRVTTTVEDNKYTIVVKDLRPEEDEGVYTLKSDHLILETPSITVVPEEKKPKTETTTVEEEEIVTVVPQEKQPEKVVEEVEEVKQIPEEKKPEEIETSIKEVEEGTTVTLTVEIPEGVSHKIIVLLMNKQPVKPSDRIKITPTSPTTIEIQIIKVKPQDEGKYSVIIDKKEQPIVHLKVIPKPVTRQIMDIPQTTFKEGETLTIECEFDATPEETFEFLRNGKPLKPNDRISTIVEDDTYTIIVKNLRPKEDEGVYTLKSDHLILDTPSITVVPKEKKPQTETTTVEEEQVTVTTVPEEETQPKVQEEEKQPRVPEEEKQPKVLEEEKQPKVPQQEKKPKVPQEEKQPTVPQEEKQPKVPEEEKQSTVPQEEKQPKVQEEEIPRKELPVHEVEETSTVTLTVEQPQTTKPEEIVLLKDGEELKPSDHVKITPTSPTTTEIQITKVKPEDEGDYTVKVKDVEQPLVRLKVHPKPVIRQEIELPKIQFNEKETLTIACQFDGTPEEPFVFLHNDEPIVPDSRVTTTVEDNKYTIVVKDLRPEEDEGVYTLKSDHLILETPSITVVPEEKKPKTETTTVEEEEIVTVVPQEKQPEKVVEEVEEVKQIPEEKKPEETEIPIKEVEEGTTVTLTVQLPEGTSHKIIVLLKNKQPVKPSERIKIITTSSTTIEIQIIKAKLQDTGKYSVLIDKKEQPIVHLKVVPKPVTRQIMDIPQTTFNEGETLTIECEFDSTPEETFEFLRNGKPLKPDGRISTIVEDNTYRIIVKNLRPKEDEGIYTLKSDHLILDTPSITVIRMERKEELKETVDFVEEIEEKTIVVEPSKKPEVVDVEVVEKGTDELPEITTTIRKPEETVEEEKPTIKTTMTAEEAAPIESPTFTEKFEEENIVLEKAPETKITTPIEEEIGAITETVEEKTPTPTVETTTEEITRIETIEEQPMEVVKPEDKTETKVVQDRIPEQPIQETSADQLATKTEQITPIESQQKEEVISTTVPTPQEEKPKPIEEEKPKPVEEEKPKPVEEEKPKPVEEEKPKPVEEEKPKLVEEEKPKPIEEEKPKPVEEEKPKPVEEETPKPIEEEKPKPVEEETPKPVEEEKPKPVEEETPKPVEEEKPKPVEEEKPKPVEEEKPKPIEEEKPKPVEEEKPKPVEEEKPKPVEEEKPKPVEEEKPKPVEEEKPKPTEEEKPKPVEEEKPKPVEEETPKAVEEEKPKLVEEEKPKPVEEEKPKPTEEEKPKPVEEEKPKAVEEEKPKPVEEEKPKPVEEEKSKPVEEEKPKPVEEEKPKPVEEEKPKPVEEEKPKPIEEEKPKPVEEEKPTPVEEEKPKPVEEEKPKPVEEEKPKPVEEEKPKPVEEEKPKPIEEEKPKPTEEEKPTPVEEEKLKPIEEQKPQPVEEQPKLVEAEKSIQVEEEQPKPTEEERPKPVEQEKPQRVEEEKSQPVEEQPKSAEEEKSRPVEQEKPKPVEEQLTSVEEEKPKPVEERPKPVGEEKPQPVEEQPKRVEEEIPKRVEKEPQPAEEEKPQPIEEVKAQPVEEEQPKPVEEEKLQPVEEEQPKPAEEEKPKPPTELEKPKEETRTEPVEEEKVDIPSTEESRLVEVKKPVEQEKRELVSTEEQLRETVEQEIPVHEVEEDTTVTLTVDTPIRDIRLLKDNKELKPSEHIKIVQTSRTTTEIQIIKAKPKDEGKYSVVIDKKEQPLVLLKVIPKPITHQTMDIPQTTFEEGETLTIKCQFDSLPEETFEFLRNGKPLKPNDRISTIVEDNTYTIVVKHLRPKEDEGVYTLKSNHLILDTPSITVIAKPKQPEKIETQEIVELREAAPTEEKKEQIPQPVGQPKPEEIPQPQETTTTEVQEQQEEITFVTEQPKLPTKKTVTELPVHEVEETSTVTLTVEQPQTTKPEDVVLLKDGKELKPSEHVKITPTSPTTTEVQITKVKPEDEGDYTVKVKDVEQPLVRLKVHPKPVIRQEMQLPKTRFNEKETLTIVCQFDATPEEPFIFLHNDEPIVPDSRVTTTVEDNKYTIVVKDLRPEEDEDSRVTTTVEDNKYTIVVKDLRPEEDEGVYTLKSDHLILDTPSITVVPEEKKPETETTIIKEETVTIEIPETPTVEVVEETIEEKPKPPVEQPLVSEEETVTVEIKPKESVPEAIVEKPTIEEIPKEEEEKTYRSELELQIVRAPAGDTITLRIPDSKTTERNEINLYLNNQPITTLNKEDSRITIEKDGETDNYVVISDVKPEDAGRYTAEFNGKLQPLCMLEVTEPRLKKSEAQIPLKEVVVEEVVEEEEIKPAEIPTYEVVEGNSINLKIEKPRDTDMKKIFLLQNDKKLEPSTRLTIKPISSTTIEIIIENVKPNDEGTYSIQFGNQPTEKLMILKVLPKPVIHDSLQLPKDVFDEGETLTIQCEFDKKPDEPLVWKLNNIPLSQLKDDRVTMEITDDGKSYILTIKDLRPKDHEGVYKLENSHLVLETPFIRVIENVQEEEEETTILVEDEETESIELQRKPKKEEAEEKPETVTQPTVLEEGKPTPVEEEKPKPVEKEKPKPAEEEAPKPVEEEKPKPVEEEKPKPVEEEKPKPAAEEKPKPVEEEKPKLVEEEKPKPTEEEKPKPVEEEKPKPAEEEKPKPIEEEKPKPAEEEKPKPTEEEKPKLVEEKPKPVEEEKPKPVEEEKPKPAEEEKPKPTEEETPKPVEEEKPKPAEEEKPKPAEEKKPKPAEEEKPKPAEEKKPKPAEEEQPKPTEEEKPKPVEEEKPKPVEEEKPKPAEEEKPKPAEEKKPKPAEEEKPKSVEEEKLKQVEEEKSKPAEEEKPKPVEEEKPKPAEEEKPKPVEEEKPKPVEEEKPKPVEEEKPKPTEEEKPKPVEEEKPKPVEEEKPKPVEEEKTKPVEEEKPKPAEEEKPKPVEEEKPKPVEEEKPKAVEEEKPKRVEEEKPKPVEEEKPKPVEEEKPKPVEEEKPKPAEEEKPKPVEEEKPKPVEEGKPKPVEEEKPKPSEEEKQKPVEEQVQPEPTPVEEEKPTPEKPLSEPVPETQPQVPIEEVKAEAQKPLPKFIKDLKPNKTTLLEGDQLIIEGELDSVPTKVQLQINGEPVPDDRVKTDVKDKKIKFTLDNIQLDESGDFTVKANDEVESKPVSITVNADIPKFVKNLTINKKQFDAGETLNFECTLNKPFTEVVWLKDGQPLEQNEHIQFTQDGPKLKLTIKDAQPEDHTGTYSLKVKDVESDKVPVTVTKKVPKFVKELKPNKTTLLEGEQLVLECELDMVPTTVQLQINGEKVPDDRVKTEIKDKKIKFTLDNIKLDESGDHTVKVNDEVESKPVAIKVNADIPKFVKNLTINKKQFDIGETLNFECTLNKPFTEVVWLKDDAQPTDHTGTYSVQVKNVESDKVPVTVTKKVPKFVKDLKANKSPLTEGEQLVLECELDMAPSSVELILNGEKVPEDRVKKEVKDKKIKFTLDNMKLDESGDYTVKVNDEVESKPVAIKVNADIPKFVKNLTINKKQFDLGETLNFECTLNKPFTEVVWLKDGQPIEQDEHISFSADGPKLKLTIKDAQPSDHTGTYSVQVKNVESDKVPVTVTKKLPKFVKDLKANKTPLTEGEQLVLDCELDMAPSKVELILNGEKVPDDRIKPEIKDKKIKFTLDNIQLNESGDFTVKVNDEVESKPVSIKVNADIPKFVKNLTINKKKFDIGETLNFECTLNKPFDQIVWLKDNEPIEEDAHIQFFVDGPKLKMTIKDAQPSDHTGTYSVRVKDVESDRIPVVVEEKPLTFVKDLTAKKTTLNENETLELSCQLSRPLKPDETIQWYRSEIEIPIEQEYSTEQINLQISNVETTMSGDYYLIISSPDEKKPLKSSTVKITIKPEEIKFLKPLRALKNPLNEDETLILECELDRPTYKNVKFSLNDKPLDENEDDRIKITQTGNKWQIQITHVKQEIDEGDYTVTINDKLTSPKVKVTIIKPLTFIQDLTVSNSEPIVDETIIFQCELSRPLPTGDSKDLLFTLNGKSLSNEQIRRLKIDISTTSPKIVLTLSNVKLTVDQGNYQLKILHLQELQSQTVNVKIRPKPIEVIQPLQPDKENVVEEDTLVLSTKLKNVPDNPTIVWLKDNQPISIDNKRIRSIPSRDGQQFKLSIENVKLDQSGTYALQINDEIITQCDINIKSIPLKTIVPLKVLGTPIVGGNVELQIELNRPNIPFVWLKDGIPLENQPSPIKDQTKYRLKLSDLKLDDSGVYSINFNDGELKENVNLNVALPSFEFIEQLKCIPSDDIEEDSNVIMQCVLNRPIDDENIPVTLLKNNKPLSAADNQRVRIERDGPTLKIHLNNVKSDDAGVYKVTVDKTKDTSTRLKVHDKPLAIIEQLHLVDAKDDTNTVSENLPFELFIRYNKPVKNVVLNRDNKRVPIDKHTQIIYEDNSTSVRIRFDAAQPDDKGKYETIVKDSTVTNKDGLRSQSVTINVKPLPVLFTSDIQVSTSDINNIPEKIELILTTTINQEKGKIKWFLNNKEIKEDQNHKIIVKNLQRQLIIKSTVIADSGIYSAKSDDDERTVELTIKVLDELRFTKELTPSNINTVEGKEKELVFECETSRSTTVQWFHDQQKLSPNELKKHYQIESLKNNTLHKLRILQPVTADSGVYRCVLPTNVETSSQCTIEPAGVDFLQHLATPVHVEYMKSALLECELSKRPQNVVWKDKRGQIIEDSDKYEIMNNGKLQGLMINDCDENDNGEYTITVDNTKSSTAEVIVEPHEEKVQAPSQKLQPEEPIKGGFRKLLPNKLNVNEDTDFILECEVNNPKQITDWYLDDDLIDEHTPRFEIINNGPIRQLKVHKAELNDTGKYTCKDRQSGETTNSDVDVAKAPIRIIKGLPETLIVPQGKI